jgi:dihydrolipoamide dehydrogenase
MNNSSKKPSKFDFDLIIIGSGATGSVSAHLAVEEGLRVGLIESHSFGGDVIHHSSIPVAALLKSALTLDAVQSAHKFGIRASAVSFNYKSIQAWKEKAIANTGIKNEAKAYRAEGVSAIRGKAQFINKWSVSVGMRRLASRNFIIASGSLPYIPDIPGLEQADYITYKQAHNLPKLPKSIFIIGGGSTAYEYAHIFSSLGSRVHVCEKFSHLMPYEDPEVGDSAEAALTQKSVRVHTSASVIGVSGNIGRKVVEFEQDGQEHRVAVEEVLIACGKTPNIDLGLANTDIKFDQNGIHVNQRMQTNQKHIYAVGDVIGQYNSISAGIKEANIAVHNIIKRKKITMNMHAIPRHTGGMPEIACVGVTEKELKVTGEIYQTSITPIGIVGKAASTDYGTGFVKLLANHHGVLLGASVVAPDASEIIQELTYAIQHRQHACTVANTVHQFPTWSETVRNAANKIRCI